MSDATERPSKCWRPHNNKGAARLIGKVTCACTEAEELIVKQKARAAGLSTSAYLRSRLPADVWTPPGVAGPPVG